MKAAPAFKTFASILGYLKDKAIHDVMLIKDRSDYYVTVGTHDNNVLLHVQIREKRVDACSREFNGKNYDLGQNVINYLTNAGKDKLIDFIHASKPLQFPQG